ncbi:MAG: glycosyltransferase family 39 protein [Pseudomonadota bacterium]
MRVADLTRFLLFPLKKNGWTDPVLWLALLLAGFLLFHNLGQRPLWQDEAETACLARNVLKFGTPLAFDGKNLISQEEGLEFGSDDGRLWRWSPWLQIYLQALGFLIFTPGTFAARFPFAVCGWLTILFSYRIVLRASGDLAWARTTAGLLSLSVPFILFARQGRYYAAGSLLAVLILYFFQDFRRNDLSAPTLAALAATGLFYANYILFFSYLAGISLAVLVFYRGEITSRQAAWGLGLTGVLLIPGLLIYRMGRQAGLFDLALAWQNLGSYLVDFFLFFLPLPVALYVVFVAIAPLFSRTRPQPDEPRKFVLFLGLAILINISCLALAPLVFTRYLVHLFPAAAVIAAWVAVRAFRFNGFSGVLLFILLGATNFLHIIPLDLPGKVKRPWYASFNTLICPDIPLRLYLAEIFGERQDVNQCAIDFFRKNAGEEDTVLATYGDLPLIFYTDLQVFGGLQGRVPPPGLLPDWILVRPFFGLARSGDFFRSDGYLMKKIDLERQYEKILLDCPAELWGARADPYVHRFLPVPEPFTRLAVYKKRKDSK